MFFEFILFLALALCFLVAFQDGFWYGMLLVCVVMTVLYRPELFQLFLSMFNNIG
jgi:hypothetical protein